ncbi:hypothetical protein [Phenylobacterium sp.]|uniref:hypothetical protein n=1 Tax=Phenylobacterium sp. TaxID=1871053 RepID=UPI002CB81F7F|nr:hypothetical protein [Phenylobacterium sp.]HLZ76489.1 hypothetical protein [Phenylobacterium sp.]
MGAGEPQGTSIMADFIFLMHEAAPADPAAWEAYLGRLSERGVLRGGSAIGRGFCLKKDGPAPPISSHIVGYLRIEVDDMAAAQGLLAGNPVFEAGGVIEVRELPKGLGPAPD